MDKNRIEGRRGTTSWHNTAKSSGLPVEVNAVVAQGSITLLPGEIWRERSGQKSADVVVVGKRAGGAMPAETTIPEASTDEGPNCMAGVLTTRWTVNPPMTLDGEVEPRAIAMGSMWTFRNGLRSVPHVGLSHVCAEPPCTDPYARWCGTRGWLSESVTGTRFAGIICLG